MNFTGQKLENDFRVREVQKTRNSKMIFEFVEFKKLENKKILKLENLINFTELYELENMNFTNSKFKKIK